MRCLFHNYGKWEDVAVRDETRTLGHAWPLARQTIKQQRRCSRCNLVQTRSS